jgi:predicted DNA-binding transcriptional regulator YafY
MPMLRRAIRESAKIRIAYTNSKGEKSLRTLKPIAIFYYVEVALLVAWCEMRSDFRQFRIDRIGSIEHLDASFSKEADALREKWLKSLAISPAERF